MTTRDSAEINGYVGEMLVAEKYLFELVQAQADNHAVARHPEAGPVLEPLRETLDRHIQRLDQHLQELGGRTTDVAIKGAMSVLGGKIGALFDRFRSETASRMLRDTYCALGLVTISYTMLHSTALALHRRATADLALDHLQDLPPLVVELSKVVPVVVVNELADSVEGADRTVGPLASNQTHAAWSEVTAGAQPSESS